MNELLIGYARVSTNEQDLTAQRNALVALGVRSNLIYTDHGLTGIGGSVHDPTDPVGRLLFNVLAMVAEFESDLIRSRTREGMLVAKAKGHLRGKQPKLSAAQQRHLMEVHQAGTHSTAELAELFNVARSTVYRTVQRQSTPSPEQPDRQIDCATIPAR